MSAFSAMASSSRAVPTLVRAQTRHFATGKRRIVPRQAPLWKDQLKKMQWPELKKEMVSFFQHFYATRDSTVIIYLYFTSYNLQQSARFTRC